MKNDRLNYVFPGEPITADQWNEMVYTLKQNQRFLSNGFVGSSVALTRQHLNTASLRKVMVTSTVTAATYNKAVAGGTLTPKAVVCKGMTGSNGQPIVLGATIAGVVSYYTTQIDVTLSHGRFGYITSSKELVIVDCEEVEIA